MAIRAFLFGLDLDEVRHIVRDDYDRIKENSDVKIQQPSTARHAHPAFRDL